VSPLGTLEGVFERDSANRGPWRGQTAASIRVRSQDIEIYDISELFTLTGCEGNALFPFSLTLP
jgi:hypothetical protein